MQVCTKSLLYFLYVFNRSISVVHFSTITNHIFFIKFNKFHHFLLSSPTPSCEHIKFLIEATDFKAGFPSINWLIFKHVWPIYSVGRLMLANFSMIHEQYLLSDDVGRQYQLIYFCQSSITGFSYIKFMLHTHQCKLM